MAGALEGKKIAFLVANEGIEQVELTAPWEAVTEAGGQAHLVAPKAGKAQAFNHMDKADEFDVDLVTADLDVDSYDAVVLPGGVANPDQLRMDTSAVAFVKAFAAANKPIAAICHGPWTLIEADVVRGKTMTSWPSLKTDLQNAGATWVDEQVHTDRGLITSRNPDDLPAFCKQLVDQFASA